MQDIRFVVVTGLSGAGKSLALRALEDAGYFCVDNLPPALIPKFAEICAQSGGKIRRIAIVVDIRGGAFFDSLLDALQDLERTGFAYQILFLEADDETLVRRFKETRRRHPLAPQGRVLEAIREERCRLEEIRGRAHRIIDTSALSPQKFREEILEIFATDQDPERFIVTVVSFGFKHGLPLDADLVFDVRFLPNPHYVDSLRPLDGGDPLVEEYVMRWPIAQQFMRRLASLVEFLLPQYLAEGKTQLAIGIGCTGGQHRSVVIANRLARLLREKHHTVLVEHRDLPLRSEA